MDGTAKKRAEDLARWGIRIGRLATSTEMTAVRPGYETVMRIDELKALHAIALSKLEEYRAAGVGEGERLRAELESACDELDAALGSP